MNTYFRDFILSLSVLCFYENVNAQNDSTYLRHSIKTNALQWIVNEPNIIYEYRFSKRIGLEATIGSIIGIRRRIDFLGGSRPFPQKGIVLRINPKIYFLNRFPDHKSFYCSPMLLLKRHEAEGNWATTSSHIEKKEETFVIGTSILLGYQSIFSDYLVFDVYCGGGYRYKEIEETKFSTTSYIGTMHHYPPVTLKRTETVPSVHAGVKLGFAFKPINIIKRKLKLKGQLNKLDQPKI